MKKYMMMSKDTVSGLIGCFSDLEELQNFIGVMDDLAKELEFCSMLKTKVDEESSFITVIKQIAIFTLFCRQHMDLIHQLVAACNVKEVTEEEATGGSI